MTHEAAPPGVTHLHNDTVPEIGGDTYWASGYTAYDHLSPQFRKIVDGLSAVYRSAHTYPNPDDPEGPRIPIERVHPLVSERTCFPFFFFLSAHVSKSVVEVCCCLSELLT